MSIDPTAFQKLIDFFFRNPYCAPACAQPNVRETPLGAEEIDQGVAARESFGRFSNG